ncbi:MAG: SH3 domain-containing protein [Spirochaetota bacterium]
MRFIIIALTLVSGVFAASTYEGEFPQGMRTAVFNETRLRSAPRNDASNVIRVIPAGTRVSIIEKSDATMAGGGVVAPWYRVSLSDAGKDASGYMWGGHLALAAVERGADMFVIGLTRYSKGDFDAECRMVRAGTIVKRLAFRPHYSDSGDPGAYYYSLSASLSGNRGVDGIENIIDVHCWFPAMDYPYGHIWIGVAKDALYPIARDTSFEESGSKRSLRRYVFPGDPSGERGIIAMIDVQYVFDGKVGDFTLKSSNRTSFRWHNNALVPAKK